MFDRFNTWFDNLREPKRFIIFFAMITSAIIPLQLGVQLNEPVSALFGLVIFVLLGLIAASRAISRDGKHKIAGIVMWVFLFHVILMTLAVLFL